MSKTVQREQDRSTDTDNARRLYDSCFQRGDDLIIAAILKLYATMLLDRKWTAEAKGE